MKNSILYIAILTLFIFNLYQIHEKKNLKKETQFIKNKHIRNNYEKIISNFLTKDSLQFLSEREEISSNIILKDLDDKSFLLEDLVDDDYKIVFHFSEFNCAACYEKNLLDFKYFIKLFGEENVLFLADYNNVRDLYNFMKVHNFACDIYNLKGNKLNIKIEEAQIPFFFLINNNLKTNLVYGVNKGYPELTKKYLKAVFDKYFCD